MSTGISKMFNIESPINFDSPYKATSIRVFLKADYQDLDKERHQYLIDVSMLRGKAEIVFYNGFADPSVNSDSEFVYRDITLY